MFMICSLCGNFASLEVSIANRSSAEAAGAARERKAAKRAENLAGDIAIETAYVTRPANSLRGNFDPRRGRRA